MASDFSDLEQLMQQPIALTANEALQEKTEYFENATVEELRECLIDVVEPYLLLKPSLPSGLRQSAVQEIKFFERLFRERLSMTLEHSPQLQSC